MKYLLNRDAVEIVERHLIFSVSHLCTLNRMHSETISASKPFPSNIPFLNTPL